MVILSKRCSPDNFEPRNSLKLSFTNIRGLCSNFVECNSFLESNSWHSCSIWDKLGWLSWFWQFLCEGLSSFNLEEFCYLYAWSCNLCDRRTSFCTGLISRKLCRFLLVFNWLYFTQCLNSFSSIDHLLCLYAQFFMLFYLT